MAHVHALRAHFLGQKPAEGILPDAPNQSRAVAQRRQRQGRIQRVAA